MNEYESEKWADYFSYCFFKKYRNEDNIESFIIKLEEVNKIQIKIYDLKNEKLSESNIKKRSEDLKIFVELVNSKLSENDKLISHIKNTIEITLNALGDIFI